LETLIRSLAEAAAARPRRQSPFFGISAIACMILQQVGLSALGLQPRILPQFHETIRLPKMREAPGNIGPTRAFWFLKSADKRYAVTFDENRKVCTFEALHGQDLSMACATDQRIIDLGIIAHEGPIPCQVPQWSCGYCWIGVLSGKERLSEVMISNESAVLFLLCFQ